MPANPIVQPEAASSVSPGRKASVALVVALVAILATAGATVALRDNDKQAPLTPPVVADSSFIYPWDLPEVSVIPELLPEPSGDDLIAQSRRQLVVVSSEADIANVSSLPGMIMPGMAIEYLVVNDAESEAMFLEIQRSLTELDARPTTIIDLR